MKDKHSSVKYLEHFIRLILTTHALMYSIQVLKISSAMSPPRFWLCGSMPLKSQREDLVI